jgi:hypothetical protein
MRRELKNIAECKKPSSDAFGAVVRSFGEANARFQALAIDSVGRAVEIQSRFVGKAYNTYISEISKLGRLFFVGYNTPQELPHANINETKAVDIRQSATAEANDAEPARRRTAAQSMTTKRKAGTIAKSRSGKNKATGKSLRSVGARASFCRLDAPKTKS